MSDKPPLRVGMVDDEGCVLVRLDPPTVYVPEPRPDDGWVTIRGCLKSVEEFTQAPTQVTDERPCSWPEAVLFGEPRATDDGTFSPDEVRAWLEADPRRRLLKEETFRLLSELAWARDAIVELMTYRAGAFLSSVDQGQHPPRHMLDFGNVAEIAGAIGISEHIVVYAEKYQQGERTQLKGFTEGFNAGFIEARARRGAGAFATPYHEAQGLVEACWADKNGRKSAPTPEQTKQNNLREFMVLMEWFGVETPRVSMDDDQ